MFRLWENSKKNIREREKDLELEKMTKSIIEQGQSFENRNRKSEGDDLNLYNLSYWRHEGRDPGPPQGGPNLNRHYAAPILSI